VLAAALCALTGCGDDGEAPSSSIAPETVETVVPIGFDLDEVTITTADGEDRTISVWLAESPEDRRRGLMGVTDLGEADAMLFVFESEALHRFYMWRTPMPLDIAFLGADGTLVGSAAMEPCLAPSAANCERYAPDVPNLMALEVPAGGLDSLGLEPGARVSRD
jgi:uncharacterized membrane protein (UPF0127 family)